MDPKETANPARNFHVPLADRIRAMGGAPAYVTRLRFIEDQEEKLLVSLARALRESERDAELALAKFELERLNRAIENHNRYFPIEANLPIDLRTGLPRHGQKPFEARPRWTPERALAEARGLVAKNL